MKVLHACAEYLGIAKTGGLADMVPALCAALRELDADLRVCVPAYAGWRERVVEPRQIGRLELGAHRVAVIECHLPDDPLVLWLLDCPPLFARAGDPYRDGEGREHADNALRFAVFGAAVARLAEGALAWAPEVVHLHDWHTGLAAAWLAQRRGPPKVVFTIHNLAYQGVYSRAVFEQLQLPAAWWDVEVMEFHHQFSFMKAGLNGSHAITTVSPSYAREIQGEALGCGLDGVLRRHADKLSGIVNGIDTTTWNPATDLNLVKRYSWHSAAAGKAANRSELRAALGLPALELPLLIFIGRLAAQKGADLVLAAEPELMQLPLQLAVLASGEAALEAAFADWARRRPERVAVVLNYDEALAHRLTAAGDLQLVPSRYEPCGLSQQYAMRYGTLPVVHRTGGLADTVVDADAAALADGSATGVHFSRADVAGIGDGVRRGLELLADAGQLALLRRAGMVADLSWRVPAQSYLDLYRGL
jgi:starch synthase